MPGFTCIYQSKGLSDSVRERVSRLVESSFKIEIILKNDKLIILFRDGNNYPYKVIEEENYFILIEGKIYDLGDFSDRIFRSHIKKIYNDPPNKESLKYLHELDGEYIIYIVGKQNEDCIIINDYLGRLPAYTFQGHQYIFSRDIFVMDKVSTGLMFDEEAVYQFLRLGFPVGEKTLYQDINRFPVSSCLCINNDEHSLIQGDFVLNSLDNYQAINKPEEALYEVFTASLRKRIDSTTKSVLSLSGGLDSRILLGEIVKHNYKVDFATFEYENTTIKQDIDVVKQLARHYENTPRFFTLNEWSPELFDEVISVKGGMNYIGMAFILEFLRELGITHQLMITGDGGDKTLPALLPGRKLTGNKLPSFILKTNAISSATNLDDLLTFDVLTYEKKLREYLHEITGENGAHRFKSFLIKERATHWLFEGEDRNRNYIWSTSPFYAPVFFKLAHSIPENDKKDYNLFRKFIDLIDPELNSFINANWGISLNDKKKLEFMFWKQRIKQRLPFRIKGGRQQSSFHEELSWHVAELLNKGFGGQVLINAHPDDLKAADTDLLFHILTLLKVSEMSWKTH